MKHSWSEVHAAVVERLREQGLDRTVERVGNRNKVRDAAHNAASGHVELWQQSHTADEALYWIREHGALTPYEKPTAEVGLRPWRAR